MDEMKRKKQTKIKFKKKNVYILNYTTTQMYICLYLFIQEID